MSSDIPFGRGHIWLRVAELLQLPTIMWTLKSRKKAPHSQCTKTTRNRRRQQQLLQADHVKQKWPRGGGGKNRSWVQKGNTVFQRSSKICVWVNISYFKQYMVLKNCRFAQISEFNGGPILDNFNQICQILGICLSNKRVFLRFFWTICCLKYDTMKYISWQEKKRSQNTTVSKTKTTNFPTLIWHFPTST